MPSPSNKEIESAILSIRIDLPGGRFGPGKAALLSAINDTGSIAAAARTLGMSYRKAWGLIEGLNAMFAAPVVATETGGAAKGGARLTEAGRRALGAYRSAVAAAELAAASELSVLRQLVDG